MRIERLQKFLAHQGLGSRREIEGWVSAGEVILNGKVAKLGDKVSYGDTILLRGEKVKPLAQIDTEVLLYHKPCGVEVTRSDTQHHQTVFSLVPKPTSGRWVTVGRLDINTSGLLLLCNDGELCARLMHPSYKIEREYEVRVRGTVTDKIHQRLCAGVILQNRLMRFDRIVSCDERKGQTNHWFRVTLREGRNREVRRLWESQDLQVSRLMRIRFGHLTLDDVAVGAWRQLTVSELNGLYDSVGLTQPDKS